MSPAGITDHDSHIAIEFCFEPAEAFAVLDESSRQTPARGREARLKPEFAHLYPPLEAGQWDSAVRMADRMVAWLLRQPNRGYMAPERVLQSEHFDFRGEARPDRPQQRRQNPA